MTIDGLSFRPLKKADRGDMAALWQEAFSDGEEFFSIFFDKGFLPENSLCAIDCGNIAAALYWFDFFSESKKIAYIYGVATFKKYRSQGIAKRLMAEAHTLLQSRGYEGVILVPAKPDLFSFYSEIGYKTATKVSIFREKASEIPVKLSFVSPEYYAKKRMEYIPSDSFIMGERGLEFFGAQYLLAEGEDFILSGFKAKDKLIVREFLGNRESAPGIIAFLGCSKGEFRTLGGDTDFSMYFPFTEFTPGNYLGIAFD